MKKYQRIFDNKKEDETGEFSVVTQEEDKNSSKKQLETVILTGIHFSGDIKGSHDIYLNGEFEGTIELSALLYVGQSGKLKGEVKAENIIIEGDVQGTLTAQEKMEVRDGGTCKGDIIAPSVLISDKAFFQGQVTMVRDGKKVTSEKTSMKKRSSTRKSSSTPPAPEPQSVTVVDDVKTVSEKKESTEAKSEKIQDVLNND